MSALVAPTPAKPAEIVPVLLVTLTVPALMPMPSVPVPEIVPEFATLEVPSAEKIPKRSPVMRLRLVMSALSKNLMADRPPEIVPVLLVTLTVAAWMPTPSVPVPEIVPEFATLSVEVPSVEKIPKTPPL